MEKKQRIHIFKKMAQQKFDLKIDSKHKSL